MKVTVLLCLFLGFLSLKGAEASERNVNYDWFEYNGSDDIYDSHKALNSQYQNPILAGFYPDPSICRVGNDYYLVNSTFSFFPGVPIFHSTDLVHWNQIGHVLDRPSQLKLDNLDIHLGIYAPAISYNKGVYYMVCTVVGGIENFFVTATNPAGPWSDPIKLPFAGFDPSFFFDDNGKAYVINNGDPDEAPRYKGHKALWLQEFDIASNQLVGPRKAVVNGGTDISKKPIWIEGPHIFTKDGVYYLIAAEGGTAEDHSEVVFKSNSVWGPWQPYKNNPILTQRDLKNERPNPITSAGHADMVETPDGKWWAVFLACRPYENDLYNTGRETFMLPVTWENGWPTILKHGQTIPYSLNKPEIQSKSQATFPLNGNFTLTDEFDYSELPYYWTFIRTPYEKWYSLTDKPGSLTMRLRSDSIESKGNPSFVGRRQQHLNFSAAVQLTLNNPQNGDKAGLVAFQNERFFVFTGLKKMNDKCFVSLETTTNGITKVETQIEITESNVSNLKIRMNGKGRYYSFYYATAGSDWVLLKENVDCSLLSTKIAQGFTGAMIGMYAFGK